jgi:hypothetical protein
MWLDVFDPIRIHLSRDTSAKVAGAERKALKCSRIAVDGVWQNVLVVSYATSCKHVHIL